MRRKSVVPGIGRRLALLAVTLVLVPAVALACPFCPTALAPTLGEQLALADVVVLVSLKSSTAPAGDQAGHSEFEVVRPIKAGEGCPKSGAILTLELERQVPKGSLELWSGSNRGKAIDWTTRTPVTESAIRYITTAPGREAPMPERLRFYGKFLEHEDDTLADDAFREFAAAKFEDVKAAADSFPREQIREWVASEKTLLSRRGLYGLMLGLSGTDDDARFLEEIIAQQPEEIRFGIDGIMGGYLYLTGEPGMEFVERSKIADPKTPFAETYAAMQALRFLWTYGTERVPRTRILGAMRRLVDRPALCDIVINDLGRWKDWSLQDRLMALYGTKDYDLPSIKRAIIRYMLASTKDLPADKAGDPPAHVLIGQKHVAALREKDPKRVAEVEKYFFLQ